MAVKDTIIHSKNHREITAWHAAMSRLWSLTLLLVLSGCGLLDVVEARQLAREGNQAYNALDYTTAIDKYSQAGKLDPNTPNLYLNLGYTYFSVYDPADKGSFAAAGKAIAAFAEHLKRHPDDENARVFQIKTLIKAAPDDPALADQALKTFLQMLEKNPADHEARQYLITLFIDCKRYEDAVAFFDKRLQEKPDDAETMKILAIIADKSGRTQEAVDWYYQRAENATTDEKKAVLFYEVGTYAWNLLHYQPDRAKGVEAIKLVDQGIQAARQAISLKDEYAEAMVYGNLLYLKRALFEDDEHGRFADQRMAFELRKAAGKILQARKKEKQNQSPGETGSAPTEGASGNQSG